MKVLHIAYLKPDQGAPSLHVATTGFRAIERMSQDEVRLALLDCAYVLERRARTMEYEPIVEATP